MGRFFHGMLGLSSIKLDGVSRFPTFFQYGPLIKIWQMKVRHDMTIYNRHDRVLVDHGML